MKIALIGLGEVGRILAEDLGAAGHTISAWDLKFADPASAPSQAADALGVRKAESAADAAARAASLERG